jgi:hypothetical protein
MDLYPSQYQLPDLTAHVLSLLERRRQAVDAWDERTEATLRAEAEAALDEAGHQFREVADDAAFWARTREAVLTVALPRYFKLARAQHALEARKYDLWRGGDFVSRAAFAAAGLVLGVVILRTPVPDWLEPAPLALFIFGPVLPDLQVWWANRRYAKQLLELVDEMRAEASERRAYAPLHLDAEAPAPVDEGATNSTRGEGRAKTSE